MHNMIYNFTEFDCHRSATADCIYAVYNKTFFSTSDSYAAVAGAIVIYIVRHRPGSDAIIKSETEES